MRKKGAKRKQGEEDVMDQPPNHPDSHRIRVKIRYTEVKKKKCPEER